MDQIRRHLCLGMGGAVALGGAAALGATGLARAQGTRDAYPARPVRIIVPFAAGGATDILARRVAEELRNGLNQTFLIDNRPGAGAMLGAAVAAKAPADGYTLLFMTNSLCLQDAINPPGKAYTLAGDFTPVASLYNLDFVLAVAPDLPVKSFPELLAYARAHPHVLNYASSGVGTSIHFGMEMLKQMTGLDATHIPYKDAPNARTDLMSGRVQIMIDMANTAQPLARQGRVRILAVVGSRRSAVLPDVPTMQEAGVKDFKVESFAGLLAPKGTPAAVVGQLHGEVSRILARAEVRESWQQQGAGALDLSVGQFSQLISDDVARWARALRETGVVLN